MSTTNIKAEWIRGGHEWRITVDDQWQTLPAPPENGEQRKWLPCTCCGELSAVPYNVVSHFCDDVCAGAFALMEDSGLRLSEALCEVRTGHEWSDNDYCLHCGLDGRA